MSWWQFVQDFQTAIVGVIGFGGVITTLLVNSRVSRNRATELRDHERDIIRRALRSELQLYQSAIRSNLESVRAAAAADHDALVPPFETIVFDSNINRLGLLGEDALEIVLPAFMTLKELDRAMALIARRSEGVPHWIVERNQRERLIQMLESTLPSIDTAINALND